MKDKIIRTCPRCGRRYTAPPALSRTDNKTEICPDCGVQEALEIAIEYICSTAKKGVHNGRTDN